MDTKTCKKCGWSLSIRDPKSRCPICGTKFSIGICAKCGEVVEYYRADRLVCKHCYDTKTRTPRDNWSMLRRREAFYNEWCAEIARIPKSYHTLTEDEWMQAVRHFGNCALCNAETIATRGYFIPFNRGGRYCNWNVIPLCEECATKTKRNPNYFLKHRPVGLNNIVDYLEEKINAAIASGTTTE